MNLSFKRKLDFIVGYFLVATNLVAARLLGLLLRRNHSLKPEPQSIIFIKILGLGSVLLAADAIGSVRKRYPSANLILICGKGVKPGVEPLGLFDQYWVIEDKSIMSLISSSISILWKSWKLKSRWVVDLEVYSKLTTIFSLWTCARNRFGFHLNPVRFRLSINTHNVYFNQFSHVGENYAALVKEMGCETPVPSAFPGYPYRARTGTENVIAVNNTCSDLSKERKMPDALFRQVLQGLIDDTQFEIALTGAPSDYLALSSFVNQYFPNTPRIKVIAGQLGFKEYYDFLYLQCRFMLTIDSAPLHIANRLHLPVLSLWGPTNPENLSSSHKFHQLIYLKKHCSPCVHHTEILPCKGDNVCMKDISMSVIKEKIFYLIQITSSSHV